MDLRAVVRESVAAWRKTKHPRIAAVAEWATARALTEAPPRPALPTTTKKSDVEAWQTAFEDREELDLPRLLAAVPTGRSPISTERVKLLATANDPRVVTWVLRTLEAPPFRAGTAQPFFRACCELLVASNDPRVRPALEDLAPRYKGIIETSVGDVIGALLARTAKGIDQVKPGPLPAAVEKKVTEWESLFEGERTKESRTASTKRSASANDDELLAAIYASPREDGPRQVYADALIERGDERGEFISLQLARARGEATVAQREREAALSGDPKRLSAWALPLSAGGDVKFGRGFPETLTISPKTARKAVGHEALRTLTHVHGLERVSNKVAIELLSSPQVRGATHVGSLTRELLDALDGPLPWPSVALVEAPASQELRRFPALRALVLRRVPTARFVGAEQVESLTVTGRDLSAAIFPSMPALRRLDFEAWVDDWPVGSFTQLRQLERLACHFAPPLKLLEGCTLTQLEVAAADDDDLPKLFAALPKLRSFSLTSEHSPLPRRLKVLELARTRGFEQVGLGVADLEHPFTSKGVLRAELSFVKLPGLIALLKAMPPDLVTRVEMTAMNVFVATRVKPEQLDEIRAATSLPFSFHRFA